MKKLLYIILILSFTNVFAQDTHFSMYYAPSIEINPATTGQFDGYFRVHAQYRDQWRSLMSNPYRTAHFAFDKSVKRFGYGAYVLDNKAGLTQFNTLKLVISGAYEITQDYRQIHHLSTGVQLGFIQKTIDPNVTYNNQYDKNYTDGYFNNGLSSGESFSQQAFFTPELNYGIYYYKTDPKHWWNPSFGLSIFHLTQPKETFIGVNNRTPIKWNGYFNSRIKLKDFYHLIPSVYYGRQKKAKELAIGTLFHYEPDNLKSSFFIGPYYRTFGDKSDSFQIHSGMTMGEYIIRFSYDITSSALKAVNNRRGGFEISITYIKERGKYIPSIL